MHFTLPPRYTKFAVIFVAAGLVMLAGAFLMTWSSATIVITPKSAIAKQQILFDVRPGASPKAEPKLLVPGMVTTTSTTVTDTFNGTGTSSVKSDIVGEVKITNTTNKDQVLVATTRLAAADKPGSVLVRLKNQVTVQAGKSVTVAVYAEKLDTFSEIKPMRLIIPGLWQPLHDKIYAENTVTLKVGGSTVASVVEEDMVNAEKLLKQKASEKALELFNASLPSDQVLWPKLVQSEIISSSFDSKVGDQVSTFTGSATIQMTVVSFDESQFISMARSYFKSGQAGQVLRDINSSSLMYELVSVSPDIASIRATVEGSGISDTSSLDHSQLVGKSIDDARKYVMDNFDAESVIVKVQPVWRTILPADAGRINIMITE